MPRFGQRFSSPFGEPTKTVEYCVSTMIGSLLQIKFKPRFGHGDRWYSIYINSVRQNILYCPSGVEQVVMLQPPWGVTDLQILVLNIGYQTDPSYNAQLVARTYEVINSKVVGFDARFTPSIMGALGDNDLTWDWNLIGYNYGVNCMVDDIYKTRCYLDFTIDTGSTYGATIQLYNHGTLVAYGYGTGTVDLLEYEGSGLSGTVEVDPNIETCDGRVYIRWPRELEVISNTYDPPTSPIDSIDFVGQVNVHYQLKDTLSVGTHYFRLRSISDTDDVGQETASLSVEIFGLPDPPTALEYLSGDYSNLVLGFTNSITPGVTYRLYAQFDGEELINLEDPVSTIIVPGGIQIVDPVPYPSISRFILRATSTGGEEENLNVLDVELGDFGEYIAARPNQCEIDLSRSSVSGYVAKIAVTQSADGEKIAPDGFEVFVTSEAITIGATEAQAGTFDYKRNGVRFGSTTLTLGSTPGWYNVWVFAVANGILSASANRYQIYASDSDVPAASEFQLYVARG